MSMAERVVLATVLTIAIIGFGALLASTIPAFHYTDTLNATTLQEGSIQTTIQVTQTMTVPWAVWQIIGAWLLLLALVVIVVLMVITIE